MAIDWCGELAEQMDFYWQHLFRPRLDGLTDDEFFWEPVDGCWSVRRNASGRWAPDGSWPPPTPAPVTTIAWRMAHIGGGVLGIRASNQFGDGSFTEATADWPASAAEGVAFVERAYRAWIDGVRALREEGLTRPCGSSEGPYARRPMATLVLHINREVFHHGAEVALLRDLYRAGVADRGVSDR